MMRKPIEFFLMIPIKARYMSADLHGRQTITKPHSTLIRISQ